MVKVHCCHPTQLLCVQFRRFDRVDDLLNDSHDADVTDHHAIYEEHTELTDELEDDIENLRPS